MQVTALNDGSVRIVKHNNGSDTTGEVVASVNMELYQIDTTKMTIKVDGNQIIAYVNGEKKLTFNADPEISGGKVGVLALTGNDTSLITGFKIFK